MSTKEPHVNVIWTPDQTTNTQMLGRLIKDGFVPIIPLVLPRNHGRSAVRDATNVALSILHDDFPKATIIQARSPGKSTSLGIMGSWIDAAGIKTKIEHLQHSLINSRNKRNRMASQALYRQYILRMYGW